MCTWLGPIRISFREGENSHKIEKKEWVEKIIYILVLGKVTSKVLAFRRGRYTSGPDKFRREVCRLCTVYLLC